MISLRLEDGISVCQLFTFSIIMLYVNAELFASAAPR